MKLLDRFKQTLIPIDQEKPLELTLPIAQEILANFTYFKTECLRGTGHKIGDDVNDPVVKLRTLGDVCGLKPDKVAILRRCILGIEKKLEIVIHKEVKLAKLGISHDELNIYIHNNLRTSVSYKDQSVLINGKPIFIDHTEYRNYILNFLYLKNKPKKIEEIFEASGNPAINKYLDTDRELVIKHISGFDYYYIYYKKDAAEKMQIKFESEEKDIAIFDNREYTGLSKFQELQIKLAKENVPIVLVNLGTHTIDGHEYHIITGVENAPVSQTTPPLMDLFSALLKEKLRFS